jgi:hypothetical protein
MKNSWRIGIDTVTKTELVTTGLFAISRNPFFFGMTLREGNREYFYEQLDRRFPGTKQKYIKTFAYSYACNSPNNAKLMQIFTDTCLNHSILYETKEVFAYLQKFESKQKQVSLFGDNFLVTKRKQ